MQQTPVNRKEKKGGEKEVLKERHLCVGTLSSLAFFCYRLLITLPSSSISPPIKTRNEAREFQRETLTLPPLLRRGIRKDRD
mmetsp:Transcript_33075/g.65605  ORF Transcript_33075/g.65605 Transcript_33075/m.65605 type:complete len:82 (-) Transcript_33075:1397-1642(-)